MSKVHYLHIWEPLPNTNTTIAGLVAKAHRRGWPVLRPSRHSQAINVLVDQDTWVTFAKLYEDGPIHFRPTLNTVPPEPTYKPHPSPTPTFVCEACGKVRDTPKMVLVSTGHTQYVAIEYVVCASCVKKGALQLAHQQHYYVRTLT